jgi:hypothetical protein
MSGPPHKHSRRRNYDRQRSRKSASHKLEHRHSLLIFGKNLQQSPYLLPKNKAEMHKLNAALQGSPKVLDNRSFGTTLIKLLRRSQTNSDHPNPD